MTMRAVKTAVDAKEKAMVEHDVTKLEVQRVRDILAMNADQVFSLENRKFQLKMSMEERRQEIEVSIPVGCPLLHKYAQINVLASAP